jgi:hypothetical protein
MFMDVNDHLTSTVTATQANNHAHERTAVPYNDQVSIGRHTDPKPTTRFDHAIPRATIPAATHVLRRFGIVFA